MATKKFDQDKAIKSILGVSDEAVEQQPQKNAKTKTTVKENKNSENDISSLIEIKAKRNKRVNFAITEETNKKLKAKCKRLGVSANEVINQLLEKFVAE